MSEYEPYEHQVGGWHQGNRACMLKAKDGGHLLKPIKLKANPTFKADLKIALVVHAEVKEEISNIESYMKHVQIYEDDKEMIPVTGDELGLYEMVKVSGDPTVVTLRELMPQFHRRFDIIRNGTCIPHLVLSDITAGMLLPCVADIKMGRTSHYPGRKTPTHEKKYLSAGEVGYCLSGLRINDPQTHHLIVDFKPDVGRTLSLEQVNQALATLMRANHPESVELRKAVLSQLKDIRKWFEIQRFFKFRASSLLIAYDAGHFCNNSKNHTQNGVICDDREDQVNEGTRVVIENGLSHSNESLSSNISKKTIVSSSVKVTVKMIDFAHVFYAEGEKDNNYIFGLENLNSFFHNEDNWKEGKWKPLAIDVYEANKHTNTTDTKQ